MQKIRLFSVGKVKEPWLEQALDEYIKRLKSTFQIEFIWAKNDAQLAELALKEHRRICLDSSGELMSSERFASFLMKNLEIGGSRLALIIGGPEGLTPELKSSSFLLSLSPMTFTHQMVRLILLEQIYRASEIAKGTGYHK
jgi:23S rRNA (pseudouridine1915-N3)-methyltransferase